jgi:hypothetical protein
LKNSIPSPQGFVHDREGGVVILDLSILYHRFEAMNVEAAFRFNDFAEAARVRPSGSEPSGACQRCSTA